MDPITLAIITAVAAGVIGGATKVGESVLTDAYGALKELLKKKFGEKSDVVKAVEGVETKPDSAGRKTTLQEEVATAKADQDPEIRRAAEALLEKVKAMPQGVQIIASAIVTGTGNVVVQGAGNVVHTTTTVPAEKKTN